MNQAIVPFTVLVSMILLGSRYIALEGFSVCIVAGAAITCVFFASSAGGKNDIGMAVLTASTTVFCAAAFCLKELAVQEWSDRKRDAEEQELDITIVGAICAVVALVMSLPVALTIQHIETGSSIQALKEGFQVLLTAE